MKIPLNDRTLSRWTFTFLILAIVLGIALRSKIYIENRSLFIDEANLARNIAERDYMDFFAPLDYQQYAPPLFLAATKTTTQVFGQNEFALRFLPFLSGLLSFGFFYWFCRKYIKSPLIQLYVLLLFSFSTLAIQYHTEFKQYSTDLLVALGILFLALNEKKKITRGSKIIKWAIIGGVSIWLSMPSVFILSAVGLSFLLKFKKSSFYSFLNLLPIFLTWLTSFIIYFFTILYQDAQTEGLQSYHKAFFFHLFPTSKELIVRNLLILRSVFQSVTDKTVLGIGWAVLTAAIGGYYLFNKNNKLLILLLSPVLFCLIASHFKLYSLIGRLTLFFIPQIMLLVGIGADYLWKKLHSPVTRFALVLIMLISVINKNGYQYFVEPLVFEESIESMDFLEKNKQEGELIYVQHDAKPAFLFYNTHYDGAFNFSDFFLANWDELPHSSITDQLKTQEEPHFWLFFSHTPPELKRSNLKSSLLLGKIVQEFNTVGSSVYKLEIKR